MRYPITTCLLLISVVAFSQTYQVYEGEKINYVDESNMKQGLWYYFNSQNNEVTQFGPYLNDKKNGLWTTYFPSGKVKHEITYKNGKSTGIARLYYETGYLREEGFWNLDHWEGHYMYYHSNGQLAYDWNYNENGKRTGDQTYFYENGNVKFAGIWDNGKTTGALKVYSDSGELISERIYEDGKFAQSIDSRNKDTIMMPSGPSKTIAHFKGTGYHTVYNLQGETEKMGLFVKGKLFNGEHFIYGKDGKISKKHIYKNGVLVKTIDNADLSMN